MGIPSNDEAIERCSHVIFWRGGGRSDAERKKYQRAADSQTSCEAIAASDDRIIAVIGLNSHFCCPFVSVWVRAPVRCVELLILRATG
jgi:hypothetical protein